MTDNYCKPALTCHNPLFEGKTSLQPDPVVINTKDFPTTDSDSTTTEEIDHKMICLSKNIFGLEIFLKPINIQKIADLCTVHKPIFNMMLYYEQSTPSCFNKLHDIVETRYVFPNSFLKEYVPIKTPGDGNCLFHAVSLSLNGKLNLTRHLRLLAAYSIVQNKDKFLQIIQADHAHI